jgi:hypothetical protein
VVLIGCVRLNFESGLLSKLICFGGRLINNTFGVATIIQDRTKFLIVPLESSAVMGGEASPDRCSLFFRIFHFEFFFDVFLGMMLVPPFKGGDRNKLNEGAHFSDVQTAKLLF